MRITARILTLTLAAGMCACTSRYTNIDNSQYGQKVVGNDQ